MPVSSVAHAALDGGLVEIVGRVDLRFRARGLPALNGPLAGCERVDAEVAGQRAAQRAGRHVMSSFGPRPLMTAAIAVLASCTAGSANSATDTPTASASSAAETPSHGLDVQSFQVGSLADLAEALEPTGFTQVLVIPEGRPNRLSMWMSEGRWHVRTDYTWRGSNFSIIQAQGVEDSLAPGEPITVRGHSGVRSDGGLYWKERGFVLALSPGQRGISGVLEWVQLDAT
jgi:hypothetical protein